MGCEAPGRITSRYRPPTRTSSSQESRVRPNDFGTHHRLNSSALVNASNTMRAGPLMVRVTATPRSDFPSTVVRSFGGAGSVSLLAFNDPLLPFQLPYHLLQPVKARVPDLA